MPEFQIPMEEVPNDWPVLPDNLIYEVRISDTEIKYAGPQAKNPGDPYINVQLEVIEPQEWAGKTMYDILNLPGQVKPTDTVGERRRKLERGINLKKFMESFKLPMGPSWRTEDWIGAKARCDVKIEEYEGRERSRPKKYYQVAA